MEITDASFSAHCPNCSGRDWYFVDDNPVARKCTNLDCNYIHYLAGPQKSKEILPATNYVPEKSTRKERVTELVKIMLARGDIGSWIDIVDLAARIDDSIQSLK